MEVWHIWIVAALLFVIIEVFTTGFAVLCLSMGATLAALASFLGCSVEWQLAFFAVFTALAFILIRPLLYRRFLGCGGVRKSGIEALPGREAVVTERIDGCGGRVSVDGDSWRAITTGNTVIDVGVKICIREVRSTILVVEVIS